MPRSLRIGSLDHIKDKGCNQQHGAKLSAWNQGTHRHDQMQNVADGPDRIKHLQLLNPNLILIGIIAKSGVVLRHLNYAICVATLRIAFSSIPLVPTRRSSSATTSAGVKP